MRIEFKTLACMLVGIFLTAGCAAGPNGSGNGTSTSAGTTAGAANGGAAGPHTITFHMSVNPSGQIDRSGNGYYIFLLNANDQPIEVTDLDTFTDMVRFDGVNFQWYHRIEEAPSPGFFLTFISDLNDSGSVSGDQTSLQVTFNVGDASSPFNTFINTNQFTAHAITTDATNGAIRGRVLDFFGPGPDLNNNESYTVFADKLLGAVNPLPANFPVDPLNDFIIYPDLASNFPYVNFDLADFDITTQ
ncbi:MAG TPA: hypothetical protein VGO93_23850 [Candidatus Xenobia bacterium]|jgi:hypothetical protein